MSHVTIRAAGTPDAAAVSALLCEFNGEGLSPQALTRRMGEVGDLETAFVGAWDDLAAGVLVLRTAPTLSGPDDWAEITEMYVRPSFRRRGIGRALVEAAVAHGRERGCRELHLLVDPQNVEAQAFYRALGLELDSWEMKREL